MSISTKLEIKWTIIKVCCIKVASIKLDKSKKKKKKTAIIACKLIFNKINQNLLIMKAKTILSIMITNKIKLSLKSS